MLAEAGPKASRGRAQTEPGGPAIQPSHNVWLPFVRFTRSTWTAIRQRCVEMSRITLCASLDVLRCPISGSELALMTDAELQTLNDRISSGQWVHRDGSPGQRPVSAALRTRDGQIAYRIEEDIAWLLSTLAIVPRTDAVSDELAAEKKVVQSFYDEYGWCRHQSGLYNDTIAFSDVGGVVRHYYRRCNDRIVRQLGGGRFLLDVASGPITLPEYLEHSRSYQVRICVDFSIRALREAHQRLGDRGLYLLGDINRLPLASEAIDAAISLHTIYHLPAKEQAAAIDELERVTRPGGRIIVVYTWPSPALMQILFRARGMAGKVWHLFRRPVPPGKTMPMPPLFFCPQDHAWFVRDVATRRRVTLLTWSAVSAAFHSRFVSEGWWGRATLAVVSRLEDWFPWFCGRFGQYPMFVLDKPRQRDIGR
jgi:SAM-dependent methyltransferase